MVRFLVWVLLACLGLPAAAQIITDDVPEPNGNIAPAPEAYKRDQQLFLLLNIGIAAPAGKFGSNDILDDEAVYATPGLDLHLSLGRTFNRYLGIVATGGFMMQNKRMDEIVSNYNNYNLVNETILDYEYPGMRFIYLAGGLLVTIPATERFAIDLKAQGGIAWGIDKELTLKIEDIAGIYLLRYGKASDVAFLPSLGTNFRLLVTDNFTMAFSIDFVMANFKFKGVTEFKNGIPVGTFDYDLPMRNVNVGIGVGWSF